MNRLAIFLFVVIFIPFLTFAQDAKTKNQNTYFGLLSKEGFRPEIDSDGDVQFKYEGKTFYIETKMPENVFKLVYFVRTEAIVGKNGCSQEFFMAINNSFGYDDGCLVRASEDCTFLIVKWYIDLNEGEDLTKEQFYNSISRIQEGVENIKIELRKVGLMK